MMKGAMVALTVMCVVACVKEPTAPSDVSTRALRAGGTWVLCEGLWRQSNSALSYVEQDNVVTDVVRMANNDERLGDTASDMVVNGDTIFIAVSGSRSIDAFDRRTGRRLARIRIDARKEPYRLALANDSTLYCTNLNDDSMSEIDARTFDVRIASVPTGPAPEGVAATRSHVFVAASGLGDLRRTEAGAGMLNVFRRSDMLLERSIGPFPNIADVKVDVARNRLWLTYRHFTSQPDSAGGLVMIDLSSFTVLQHWRLRGLRAMALDASSGTMYALHANGVDAADDTGLHRIVDHQSDRVSVWYAVGFDVRSGRLWIGDAKSYVTDGDAVVLSTDGHEVGRFRVGLNPTAFAFP